MRRSLGWCSALAFSLLVMASPARAQSCEGGRVSSPATAGRCCWPSQEWSRAEGACTGAPTCPSGLVVEGTSCVPAPMAACTEGRVATTESAGRCCWPGQTWARDLGRCDGPPSCPAGLAASGDSCVPSRDTRAAVAPVAPVAPVGVGMSAPTRGGPTAGIAFTLDQSYDEPLILQYEDVSRSRRDRWQRLCTLPCQTDVPAGHSLGVGFVDHGVARFPSDFQLDPRRGVSIDYEDRSGLRTGGLVLTTISLILGVGGVAVGTFGAVFHWSSGVIIAGFAAGGGVLVIGCIIGLALLAQGDRVDVASVRTSAREHEHFVAHVEPDTRTSEVPTVTFDL